MADYYEITLNNFFVKGTAADFSQIVARFLSAEQKGWSSQKHHEAECFSFQIFHHLFEIRDRGPGAYIPLQKLNLSLDKEENICQYVRPSCRKSCNDAVGEVVHEYMCYIRLKSTTMTIAALLLDIIPTNNTEMAVLAFLGVKIHALIRIKSYYGERCVLMETCRNDNKTAGISTFNGIRGGECVNNRLICKYKKGGICTISEEEVGEVFNLLAEKKILKKKGSVYRYCPDSRSQPSKKQNEAKGVTGIV